MRTNTEISMAIYHIRLRLLITLKTFTIFTTNWQLPPPKKKNAPSPGEIQISRNTRFFGPVLTQVHMTNSNSIGSPFLKLTVVANTQGHKDHAMYVIIGHIYALHTRYAV